MSIIYINKKERNEKIYADYLYLHKDKKNDKQIYTNLAQLYKLAENTVRKIIRDIKKDNCKNLKKDNNGVIIISKSHK